jgi:hypothetical protein
MLKGQPQVNRVRPDSLLKVGRTYPRKSRGHPRQSMPCSSRMARVHPTIASPDQHSPNAVQSHPALGRWNAPACRPR